MKKTWEGRERYAFRIGQETRCKGGPLPMPPTSSLKWQIIRKRAAQLQTESADQSLTLIPNYSPDA